MIDRINQARPAHILTIEDPIEYLHQHKTALVNQRELHADTQSFTMALRAALREDPDVVLVGEMRDLETMEAALKLAETGHLTMATLHTNSAAQTITRIIDAFPAASAGADSDAALARARGHRLSGAAAEGQRQGRVAALEILVATPAIRNLIRDDKIHQIYGTMQAGQEKFGMQTMNQSLARLVERRVITRDAAFATSSNRDELVMMLERGAAAPAAAALADGRGRVRRCDRRCSDDDICLGRAEPALARSSKESAGRLQGRADRRAPARADSRHQVRPRPRRKKTRCGACPPGTWRSSRASSPS